MQPLFRLRRFTAWLALCATLLWTLMPAMDSAGSAPGGVVEVCTLAGTAWIAVPADGNSAPAGERSDCPWCCAQAGGFALLPPGAALPAVPAAGRAPPVRAAPGAARVLRWQLSFARAPPALS